MSAYICTMTVCWRNCTSLYGGNERLFGNDDEDYDDDNNNSNNKIVNLATSLLIVIVSEMKMLWKSWRSPLLTKTRTYHHHHHHLANMDLGHMLTYSGLTHLEVSLTVFPGFFCLLVCSCLISKGNLSRDILFMCRNHFFLYSCILSKTGVIFISHVISVLVS